MRIISVYYFFKKLLYNKNHTKLPQYSSRVVRRKSARVSTTCSGARSTNQWQLEPVDSTQCHPILNTTGILISRWMFLMWFQMYSYARSAVPCFLLRTVRFRGPKDCFHQIGKHIIQKHCKPGVPPEHAGRACAAHCSRVDFESVNFSVSFRSQKPPEPKTTGTLDFP